MNVKNEIERLIKIYGSEVCGALLQGEFELMQPSDATATVKVGDEYFSVWMANEDYNTEFYDSLFGPFEDDVMTKLLKKYYPIPEDQRSPIRNNIKEKQKELEKEKGVRKSIKQTQLSNDLFFKFDGVYGQVRFTGYNDSDWWAKYKPTEVKEDETITWTIDYDKMEAVYKPKSK